MNIFVPLPNLPQLPCPACCHIIPYHFIEAICSFLFLSCQAHSLLWISVPRPPRCSSHTSVSHFECHLFREAPRIAASSVLFSTPLQLIRARHRDTLFIQQVVCLSYVSTSSWDENPDFLITHFRVLSFRVIGWLSQCHRARQCQRSGSA